MERKNMVIKYKDLSFLLIVVSLLFSYIPKNIQLNFLLGNLAHLSTAYILIPILLVYIYYKRQNNEPIFQDENIVLKRYTCIVFFVSLLNLIYGLFLTPVNSTITSSPIHLIGAKLANLLPLLTNYSIPVNPGHFAIIWVLFRFIKYLFSSIILNFGTIYLIYAFYHDDKNRMIRVFQKGLLLSLLFLVIYSVFEILFILGNERAREVLVTVNPLVHAVEDNGSWYPPLLWWGQLRLVFTEPSFCGTYLIFIMPWLWLAFVGAKFTKVKIFYFILMYWGNVVLFFTKSRTGLFVYSVQLALLLVICIFINRRYSLKNKFLKPMLLIVVSVPIAFFNYTLLTIGMNINSSRTFSAYNAIYKSQNQYFKENIASAKNINKRSNKPRFSVLQANLSIGMSHPIFGVGPFLRRFYVLDYLPTNALNNEEVKSWYSYSSKFGKVNFDVPTGGELFKIFAEQGIVGLSLFILPALYVTKRIYKIFFLKNSTDEDRIRALFYAVSLGGTFVVSFINPLSHQYWVLLGMGMVLSVSTKK